MTLHPCAARVHDRLTGPTRAAVEAYLCGGPGRVGDGAGAADAGRGGGNEMSTSMQSQPDLFVPEANFWRCALLDPPWPETGGCNRGADSHYETHSVQDILAIVRASGRFTPHPDGAHLWMWSTVSSDEQAHWLIEALGFRYVTQAVWVKWAPHESTCYCAVPDRLLQRGLGQYMRCSHEMLLLGVRGNLPVPPPSQRPPSVIFARRGKHSEKPEESYRWPEQISPGPRLEMFARTTRPGWSSWGNEVMR